MNTPALNGNEGTQNRQESSDQQPSSIAEAMILDTEVAVIANFEFLGHTDMDMEEEKDGEDEIYDANTDTKLNKASLCFCSSFHIFIIFSFVLLKNIFCHVRM
ncbi:uncharacterized protein LOC105184574 [Harpegnathos saltator]|uniref:uncharacterized protein LOC105184574 n=1 Tax=Harpegnathos saltator TaxID=610380 RepID=UPI0009488CE1|nr:uncharacterized protein LOC105184574 [Harpegnathos saltator]